MAVQEYGLANPDLVEGLAARGAQVVSVPIYRWSMPEDVAPLQSAVQAIVRDEIDIVILTAGIQLVHLLRVAAEMGPEADVRRGLERAVVASIGPMTSDELRRQGLPIDFEPSHPKMGFLVKEAAEQCGRSASIKTLHLTHVPGSSNVNEQRGLVGQGRIRRSASCTRSAVALPRPTLCRPCSNRVVHFVSSVVQCDSCFIYVLTRTHWSFARRKIPTATSSTG